MKKMLVVLMSAMLVLGGFAVVSADDGGLDSARSMKEGTRITIGGDAYVSGIWLKNFDFSEDDDDNDVRFYEEKVRFKINADLGDGVMLNTRIRLLDDTQLDGGNTNRTGGADGTWVDYAYIHAPLTDAVAVEAGILYRSFGNKFYIDSARRTGAQLLVAAGPADLTIFADKINETSTAGDQSESAVAQQGDENLEDSDNYGIEADFTISDDMSAGVMLTYENDQTDPDDDTGTELSAYFNGSFGAISVAAELATKGGDLNEIVEDQDAQLGGFVSVGMGMGAVDVSGSFAFSSNGFTADSHFTPTYFVGTDQTTALVDLTSDQDDADSTSWLLLVQADMDVTDDIALMGRIAYADMKELADNLDGAGDADDATAWEIDLGFEYAISGNTTYSINYGYIAPTDVNDDDDAAQIVANTLEVSF